MSVRSSIIGKITKQADFFRSIGRNETAEGLSIARSIIEASGAYARQPLPADVREKLKENLVKARNARKGNQNG